MTTDDPHSDRVIENSTNINNIYKILDDFKNGFVRKEEFAPIKSIVYGMVGFILLSFLIAVMALVTRK